MSTKEPRKCTRRNFQKELETLKTYIEIKIDVLKSIDGTGSDPLWKSTIEAYQDVLRRLEGK